MVSDGSRLRGLPRLLAKRTAYQAITCIGYGGVIRRTGIGDVPIPPTTGGFELGVLLQPAMFKTVILMSPGLLTPGPGSTQLMKACRKPTIFTGGIAEVVSMIGMVTIELLVLTFPEPLPAAMVNGPVGHGPGLLRTSWRLFVPSFAPGPPA